MTGRKKENRWGAERFTYVEILRILVYSQHRFTVIFKMSLDTSIRKLSIYLLRKLAIKETYTIRNLTN